MPRVVKRSASQAVKSGPRRGVPLPPLGTAEQGRSAPLSVPRPGFHRGPRKSIRPSLLHDEYCRHRLCGIILKAAEAKRPAAGPVHRFQQQIQSRILGSLQQIMNMDWVELPMRDCGFYRRLRRSQTSQLVASTFV
jgi:hypothetical protein